MADTLDSGYICVLGDSDGVGAWDLSAGGWVARLHRYLLTKQKCVLYNLSIDGETTLGALQRFDAEVSRRSPAVIVVALGLNDSARSVEQGRNLVRIEDYRMNLHTLVAKARRMRAAILFVGLYTVNETKTTPVSWDDDLFYENETVAEYDRVLHAACNETSVPYVAVSGVVTARELAPDGLHPNDQGHENIFRAVLKSLEENKFV